MSKVPHVVLKIRVQPNNGTPGREVTRAKEIDPGGHATVAAARVALAAARDHAEKDESISIISAKVVNL